MKKVRKTTYGLTIVTYLVWILLVINGYDNLNILNFIVLLGCVSMFIFCYTIIRENNKDF